VFHLAARETGGEAVAERWTNLSPYNIANTNICIPVTRYALYVPASTLSRQLSGSIRFAVASHVNLPKERNCYWDEQLHDIDDQVAMIVGIALRRAQVEEPK
jgi:hypothetical protein